MEFYVQFSLNCYIIRSSRTGISALRKSFIKRKSNLRKRRVLKVANKTLIGSYPAIGIRPVIDGRTGPMKLRFGSNATYRKNGRESLFRSILFLLSETALLLMKYMK